MSMPFTDNQIHHKKEKSEEKHRHNDNKCCARYFTSRLGQETFLSSFRVSLRKSNIFYETIPSLFQKILSFARLRKRIAGHHRHGIRNSDLKLAGQEGLEPPTCGFGDRRSTNSSYWPVPISIPVMQHHRLACFLVRRVSTATITELLEFQPLRRRLLVLGRRIVAAFALRAFKRNNISHGCSRLYSRISEMVPAPTVRPPSRIANRNPFSIAIGVISLIVRLTLSPGITISVPSGNSATPVTSVVRK